MATLTLAPDIGLLAAADRFDPAKNPFVLTGDIGTFQVATEAEGLTTVKGFGDFRLTLGGVVYEIPISLRARLRAKSGGLVHWQTDTAESGQFRFYREPLPVFPEEELAG